MNDIKKVLEHDSDGMAIYDYIVNNVETCREDLPILIERLREVDLSGQFLASAARFLHAVDSDRFDLFLSSLINGAIEKDRERKYIGSLLQAIWGDDYESRSGELMASDDNFRRIYKRVYTKGL